MSKKLGTSADADIRPIPNIYYAVGLIGTIYYDVGLIGTIYYDVGL